MPDDSVPADPDKGAEEAGGGESVKQLPRPAAVLGAFGPPPYQFRTDDDVEIWGSLKPSHVRELVINNFRVIAIDRKEYLVLLVLARYRNCTGDGLLSNLGYLAVSEIVEYVDMELDAAFPGFTGRGETRDFWAYPTDTDIRKAVYSIRRKLSDIGVDRHLIETGPRGAGYRISTSDRNITLKDAAL